MITPLLQSALEPVITRQRTLRGLRWLVLGLTLLVLALVAALAVGFAFTERRFVTVLFVIFIACAARVAGRSWLPDFRAVARRIELRHPELHALLITAVEQKPDPQTGHFTFLQRRVITQITEHSRPTDWIDAVPGWRLWSLRLAALLLACASLLLAFRTEPRAASLAVLHSTGETVSVSPGDTTVERGSGLVVLADFHHHPPGEATLAVQPQNQPAQRLSLVKNLDDPVFGGGLPEVDADLTYHVEYAGQTTRDFTVKVFEHPRLDRADATLRYPAYTKLPEKKIPDTHRVSAVEGTKLDVAFQLNKPVKSATLITSDGRAIPLAVQPGKPLAELRDYPLQASQTYQLKLEDADGRANKLPAQFIVEALPNRKPELKFITPKGDPRVSPIEEVTFRTQVWDDFGLSRYGLTVNVAGRGEQQIELGRATHADEKKETDYLLKLEDLGVKPDELISWYLWADDAGPDGKTRRTVTDIYFGEVRPFEEIFRRDNSGGGDGDGDGESEGESTKLAEMQKQIVSATWNLKRAEDGGDKPSDQYLKDEPVVRDSQSEALEKASALANKAEDPKLHALVENAVHEMQSALSHLARASTATTPLPDALTAEQAAYDALLKLAAHEFRVRQSKSQGKGKAQQKQRQQLDQLEMKDEKERYETNREAKPKQDQPQREQLAILNRLKELAQRQQDINERIKELQTALQDAKTEQQKEEVRRQLKRLQEEQQQLLSDLDETKQKMEQSAQQAQLADERRQLDKTRSEAQQAAESMEKGAPSQALANGTRAQRDLQELKDDFRKKTSGQFTEEMRQMRNDARNLAEKQEELGEKLQPQAAKPERPTLDGTGEREQLADKFARQQADLGQLTDKMKDLSEQAEAAEPLLAKELYDTLRKTTQAGTDKTLEQTQHLARGGNAEQARPFEEKARREIEEVKTGVERAAESVLGNEAEALRAARTELDSLKKDVEQEVARARPDLAQTKTSGNSPTPQAPSDKATPSTEKSATAGQTPGNAEQKPAPGSPGQTAGSGGKPGSAAPQPGSPPSDKSGGSETGTAQGNGNNGSPHPAGNLRRLAANAGENASASNAGGNGGGGADTAYNGPLTGDHFVEWSDRLRNVEEAVDDPNLRAEIARIRETAKGIRVEYKRHGTEPKWDMVEEKVGTPLAELHDRLTEELARRESKENLVPLDRDPVPPKYAERVRRYYEELGRSH